MENNQFFVFCLILRKTLKVLFVSIKLLYSAVVVWPYTVS